MWLQKLQHWVFLLQHRCYCDRTWVASTCTPYKHYVANQIHFSLAAGPFWSIQPWFWPQSQMPQLPPSLCTSVYGGRKHLGRIFFYPSAPSEFEYALKFPQDMMYFRVAIWCCAFWSRSQHPERQRKHKTRERKLHTDKQQDFPNQRQLYECTLESQFSQLRSKSSAVQSQLPRTGRRAAVGLNGDQQEIPNKEDRQQ